MKKSWLKRGNSVLKRSWIKRKPKNYTPGQIRRLIKKATPSRKAIIDNLDDIFREIIRLRDGFTCQRTRIKGDKYSIDVSHFYSRSYFRTRWDLENACCLTKGQHKDWAHVKHQEFSDWWEFRIGKEAFERLKLKARVKGTIYTSDLLLLKLDLLSKLKYFSQLSNTIKEE